MPLKYSDKDCGQRTVSLTVHVNKALLPLCEQDFLAVNVKPYQWRIQDFPKEGVPTPPGPRYDFANFSQKLHEIERIWNPRGVFLAPPPPLLIHTERQVAATTAAAASSNAGQ